MPETAASRTRAPDPVGRRARGAGRAPRARAKTPRRGMLGRGAATATVAILPFVLFIAIFAAYPLFEVLRMSFSQTEIVDGSFVSSWAGIDNYTRVLADGRAWNSIMVTTVFIAAAVGGTLVLGLALALLVNRAVLLLGVARNVLIWPAVVAPVVVSLMWLLIFSPTVGGINKVAATLGLPQQSWLNSEAGALTVAIVVDVWHWTPIVFLFLYTALQAISQEILESARIDGAGEAQILRYIVLPLLRPAIAAAALIRVVQGVKAFDEIYLLTRGGPNDATMLVSLHIRNMFFDRLDFGYAAALSIIVVVATAAIVGILAFLRSKIGAKA